MNVQTFNQHVCIYTYKVQHVPLSTLMKYVHYKIYERTKYLQLSQRFASRQAQTRFFSRLGVPDTLATCNNNNNKLDERKAQWVTKSTKTNHDNLNPVCKIVTTA